MRLAARLELPLPLKAAFPYILLYILLNTYIHHRIMLNTGKLCLIKIPLMTPAIVMWQSMYSYIFLFIVLCGLDFFIVEYLKFNPH